MKTKIIKQNLYIIMLLLTVSLASAMTIDELIESYDYDLNDGTINVTLFDDYMTDEDSDGINDTLTINLTTDANASTSYYFIVSLVDLIQNSTNATVSSASQSVQVSFDTKELDLIQYNYSVEIRDENYSLVYMKYKTETNNYTNYEKGTSITSISDQNLNNDSIRITLNLNVTDNQTSNITAYLNYNNKTILTTKEVSLTIPSQTVNIDFDNETIKSTHYDGIYNVDAIVIANKLIDTDYNTSSYDFEDFAKSSYLYNITSSQFDNNSNDLYDALEFNFSINVKSSDNYTIEASVYDLEDNYITTISKNQSLSAGNNIITAEIPGEEIYSTYYYGEFLLPVVKLSIGNETIDVVYDAHNTNITYYADFEKPPLPDLTIKFETNFSDVTNETNVTINITNQGDAPAFNIIAYIFDNESYENQSTIAYLNNNESTTFSYVINNINSIVTAIVDLNNFVDEYNETNNIYQESESIQNLTITNLSLFNLNERFATFEFEVQNNGNTEIDNISFDLDFDDGSAINNTESISLNSGETETFYVEHNYSQNRTYYVKLNVSAENISDYEVLPLLIGTYGEIITTDFNLFDLDGKSAIFEFEILNNGSDAKNVTWTLDTGEINITNEEFIELAPDQYASNYVEYNYTDFGDFIARLNVGGIIDTLNVSVNSNLDVFDLSLYSLSYPTAIFEFFIKNNLDDTNLTNVSFRFDTGENNITSEEVIFLETLEEETVFIEHNYSNAGNYTVEAFVYNNTINNSEQITIEVV